MFTELMASGSGGDGELTATSYNYNKNANATRTLSDLKIGKEYIAVICSGYDNTYPAVTVNSISGTEGNTYEQLSRGVSQDSYYSRYTVYNVIKFKASDTSVILTLGKLILIIFVS